jgi:hypothetical protein
MSIAAAFLLAAAAAPAPPADAQREPDRGAQVETAQMRVTILRAAVLKDGAMMRGAPDLPRARRHVETGRVAYTFE